MRVQTELTSDTAQVEDRFEATTVVDLYRGNDVLIPAGSVMRGVVSSVNRGVEDRPQGQPDRRLQSDDRERRSYPMRGTVTEALESEGIKGEAGRIGAGSAVGAIIGGILGGVKGRCSACSSAAAARWRRRKARTFTLPTGNDPARAHGYAAGDPLTFRRRERTGE